MTQIDQATTEASMLLAPKEINRPQSTFDKLSQFGRKVERELVFTGWNAIWAYIELFRDSTFTTPTTEGSEFISRPFEPQSGALGFANEHIGSSLETIELFYGTRAAMWLTSLALEKMTKLKVSPTVQVALSMFIATVGISGIETGTFSQFTDSLKATSDNLDVFGPLFMAAWAGGGYKAIQFLFEEGGSEKLKQFMMSSWENIEVKASDMRVVAAEMRNNISNGIEILKEKNRTVDKFTQKIKIMFPAFFRESENINEELVPE